VNPIPHGGFRYFLTRGAQMAQFGGGGTTGGGPAATNRGIGSIRAVSRGMMFDTLGPQRRIDEIISACLMLGIFLATR